MRGRRPPIGPPSARFEGQFNRRAALLAILLLAGGVGLAGAGCEGLDKDQDAKGARGGSGAPSGRAPAPPRPATAEEMALLAPLEKGTSLGGWEVLRIEGTDRGALRVVCVKGRALVRLYVALATDGGPAPPATAGRYAIFYSLKDATAEEGERLATELAAVIKKNQAAPPPAGMTPFEPRQKEPISL
ncbi:MAG TPA: hypothetical protein VE093_07665 [Polyangiaceae bacterium]|jgi:hypothetical protein|nr:hypothetical protein [Polyangiaceae bacterium]